MRKFTHLVLVVITKINNKLQQWGKAAAYAIHR